MMIECQVHFIVFSCLFFWLDTDFFYRIYPPISKTPSETPRLCSEDSKYIHFLSHPLHGSMFVGNTLEGKIVELHFKVKVVDLNHCSGVSTYCLFSVLTNSPLLSVWDYVSYCQYTCFTTDTQIPVCCYYGLTWGYINWLSQSSYPLMSSQSGGVMMVECQVPSIILPFDFIPTYLLQWQTPERPQV
jgi:hypothetical protein